MKLLIKKLLRECLVNEVRISLNDMNNYVLVYLREESIFLIINKETKKPMGYISFALTDGDVYGIYGAYAKSGFGPLLYELVMTMVYPKGITMSDDSSTSYDALNVWYKFDKRGDIIKKPIHRINQTDKEEILAADNFEDYDEILRLHKTQFIYNLGKDKLEKLIEIGDKFVEDNEDLDLVSMVYSLE
jgi:hypothetical protein